MLLYYGIIKVSSPETAKYTPTPIPPPTIIINKIISKITLQVLFPSSSVSVLNWVQNAEMVALIQSQSKITWDNVFR